MATPYPHVKRGVVCALLGGVCWGFSANCAEVLLDDYGVGVEWITCVRMLLAAAFFLSLTLARGGCRKVVDAVRDLPSMSLIAGFSILGILLTQYSYLSAIGYAGAGTALLLEQLGLALVMLYLCVKARRLPYARELLGLMCALVGVLFITTQGDLGELNVPALGLFWGLVSAVSLAFYNLMPVKPLAKYGSFLVTGLAMLMGGIVAVAALQPWEVEVVMPLRGWVVLAANVIIGTILAYMLYIQGIRDAGPMRAGLLGSVEPVSAMIISAVWLGDAISMFDVLGAACIVAMIALVTQREKSDV